MPKALIRERFASAIVRSEPTGWNMPSNRTGSTRLDAERHDVLDLEVDHVADADAVTESVVVDVDRGAFDPEHLAHQRSQRSHRSAELAAEDLDQLVELLVRCLARR